MAETSGRPVLVSQINRFSGYAYSAADLVHDDDDLVCYSRSDPVWAAHLSSRSTLLLKDEHPPAGLPFDAARSPDATRGATPARTRMASATCATCTLTLDGPRLPILGLHLAQLRGRPGGAGRGLSLAVTRRIRAAMRSHACVTKAPSYGSSFGRHQELLRRRQIFF
jgi:hypothetical protein